MKELNKALKEGNLSNLYLLYGEEAYLRKHFRDKIRQQLVPSGDTMNYHYYQGKNISIEEIVGSSITMPFLSNRRLVIVEDSEVFTKSDQALLDLVNNLPSTTTLLFLEEGVDKRGKLYKLLQEKGKIVYLGVQQEDDILQWIAHRCKQDKISITRQAAREILVRCGSDLKLIEQEVEKLVSYCLEKGEIFREDVTLLVAMSTEGKVFELVREMMLRKRGEALGRYYDLLDLRESPIKILAIISRQIMQMRQIKDMKQRGMKDEEIGKAAGMASWQVKKLYALGQGHTLLGLKELSKMALHLEEDIKSGRIQEEIGVELLIVEGSRPVTEII